MDLQRFRALTTGHHVLMGRRTCESLGRPLPERVNLVLSTQPEYVAQGFTVVHSIEAALARASSAGELFVIGGASIYAQTLARAQYMYLTLVHADIAGDTWFPRFDRGDWDELERVAHPADRRHEHAFTFLTLRRRGIAQGSS